MGKREAQMLSAVAMHPSRIRRHEHRIRCGHRFSQVEIRRGIMKAVRLEMEYPIFDNRNRRPRSRLLDDTFATAPAVDLDPLVAQRLAASNMLRRSTLGPDGEDRAGILRPGGVGILRGPFRKLRRFP